MDPVVDIPRTFDRHLPCSTASGEPCLPCINLIKLEAQMVEETGQKSSSLVIQHREMKTKVNQEHDPISRSLPLEIISLIFDFSIERLTSLGVNEEWMPEDFDDCSVLRLGAVCASWRKIAWATPRLWSCIAVCLNIAKFPARAMIAQDWLRRSGSLPLYILVVVRDSFTDIPEGSSLDPVLALIDSINALSERWRVLHLELPLNLLPRFRSTSATPVLHTLRLSGCRSDQQSEETHTIDHSTIAPLAVAIAGISFQSLKFQWNRLTMFSVSKISVDDLMKLIIIATGLHTCLVEELESSTIISALPFQSALRNLRIGGKFGSSEEGAKQFFKIVQLPSLRRLGVWVGDQDIPAILKSLIKRSQCSLEYLGISTNNTHWDDLVPLLDTTKSLERLVLKDFSQLIRQQSEIFQQFDIRCCSDEGKQEPLLPNLRNLSFSVYVDYADKDWDFLLHELCAFLVDSWEMYHTHEVLCHGEQQRRNGQRLGLSLYLDTITGESLTYIEEGWIRRILGIMERGVSLDITASIVSLDSYAGEEVDDVIHQSMLCQPEEFSQEDINTYFALANSLDLHEWED